MASNMEDHGVDGTGAVAYVDGNVYCNDLDASEDSEANPGENPPGAPTNFTAVDNEDGTVDFSWTLNDPANDESAVEIWNSTTGFWVEIRDLDSTPTVTSTTNVTVPGSSGATVNGSDEFGFRLLVGNNDGITSSNEHWIVLVGEEIGQGTTLFEQLMTGTNDEPLHEGSGNAHAGGGWWDLNPGGISSDGINGTNWDVATITDDPVFPGSIEVMRVTYKENLVDYDFNAQTWKIHIAEAAKVNVKGRFRFSDNWQFANEQLKFCKITSVNGNKMSTSCPKFGGSNMKLTKLNPDTQYLNTQSVHAVWDGYASINNIEDDINNAFGDGGVDKVFSPVNGQWYWLEWEVDTVSAGSSSGYLKIWIDGVLYISISDVQITEAGDTLVELFELGHVWQDTGSFTPDADIYLDVHNLVITNGRT